MEVNWLQLLVEGGLLTSIVAVVEILRDWRNKRNKDKADVKKTDYEAQRQGLDLVQEFYDKVKQVTDDQNKQLFERLDKIESLQSDIVTYLNGDFAQWQKEHNSKQAS